MSFDALAIANYFLDKAQEEGRDLTHMHLQKILYNAHGYHLAIYGRPLFRQPVEAWKYGPVIPAVYKAFRDCGSSPIAIRAEEYVSHLFASRPVRSFETRPIEADLDDGMREFLDAIWDGHKKVPAVRLSAISHVAGGPWHQVAQGKDLAVRRGVVIPDDIIRDYFKKETQKWADDE